MTTLTGELQTYFSTFARTQRDLSEHTIAAYRDTWRMLLTFLTDRTATRVEDLDFDQIDAVNVTAFLDHLEQERGNSVATRNARLSAIRAVLSHALPHQLDHAATISRVLAIPPKRHLTPILEFLTAEETDALIAAPDRTRWTGRRDHALLVLAIQTGLRISELCSLTYTDLHLGVAASVSCTGKGRRTRATPLTSTTTAVMTTYLTERRSRPGSALFCGPRGQRLSRDALEHRLAVHAATAAATCASLADKHLTMHTLRHTAAMNLLAEGVDISVIALWLGHQRTQSTDVYMHADMTIKQSALDRTRPTNIPPGTYQPEADILTWLAAL
ncbi:tyrosine-type recombinase/integrase [Rhodococcus sp. JVH1]|uniref:tyrosine-type recombinase/integrase n=1 Tax=Rhodococcus sp. JVH1 TaxID=745408 RepID=UPI000271F039|nr:tyrosine-type recombinase/integrase [Rhodococcus sp. JVH1]EJI93532.1 phage integrase, N-terminal SAM-like domain protein [Rhodococcus sp. JVH1]